MVPGPQRLSVLGLLALVPAAVYLVASGAWVVAFGVVNVLLIVGSLYHMLSPAGSEPARAAH
ncbi:MAG: cytochrome-ba3 oxidase subunit [Halorientalis sp.]